MSFLFVQIEILTYKLDYKSLIGTVSQNNEVLVGKNELKSIVEGKFGNCFLNVTYYSF